MEQSTIIILDFLDNILKIDFTNICNPESKLRKEIKKCLIKLNKCYKNDIELELKDKYLEYEEYFKSKNQSYSKLKNNILDSLDNTSIYINNGNTKFINKYYIDYCNNFIKFILLSLRANKEKVYKFIKKNWKVIGKSKYISYNKNIIKKLSFFKDNASTKLYDSYYDIIQITYNITPSKYCDILFEIFMTPIQITMVILELNILISNEKICKSIFKS